MLTLDSEIAIFPINRQTVSESVFTISKVLCCDQTEDDRATVQTTTNTDNTSSSEDAQVDRTTGQSIINADITQTRLYYPEVVVLGKKL